MNTQSVVMVQISNRAWTLAALESACRVARTMSAKIALVQMIPVQHPALLGTDSAYVYFSEQEQADFSEYQLLIEAAGIDCAPLLFQYASLVSATTQAAEHVHAQVVYARIPKSVIPCWTKLQVWMLRRGLNRQQCQLIQYPLDSAQILMPVPAVELRQTSASDRGSSTTA